MGRLPRVRRRQPLGFSFRFAVFVIWPFMRTMVKWEFVGTQRLAAAEGGIIVAPNHVSWFDPPVVAYALWEADRPPRFLGKEAVFRAMHARTLAEASCSCDHAEAADLPFAERLYLLLDAQCGKAQERYARSAHLLELDDTRTRIGADLGRAADAAYAERLLRVFRNSEAAGEIDLRAAGLSAEAVVDTLLAATKGAKQGPDGPLDLTAYRERLRQIANLAAAAVRPRRP